MTPSLRADIGVWFLGLALSASLISGCQPATAPPPGTDGSSVDNSNDNGPPVVAGGGAVNDLCADATAIDGAVEASYDLTLSSTDGPSHAACSNQGSDQIDNDVWYCWTAECDGVAVVSTCGMTEVDTRVAVYAGCDCPPTEARLLTCADDGCGLQTRATIEVQAGSQYLVRVGMFPPTEAGPGSVRISCGFAACPAQGSCDAAHEGAGCADADCCNSVCSVDSLCCEDAWDDYCVNEAAGLCGGGFAVCGGGSPCTAAQNAGGCADQQCCNSVCGIDPYCCIAEWDETCVELEAATCFGACTASAGDCSAAHSGPGCSNQDCCSEVCPRDTFCCTTEWDAGCASLAADFCQ